jgi:protein-arginine kinase activator protein McsA
MLCSHCNKNEAESIVYLDYMGQKSEMYLCGECMNNMRQYMSGFYRQFSKGIEPNGEPQTPVPEEVKPEPCEEGAVFPIDAGDAIRDRRRLGELKAKLTSAIQREEYEEAAALRDEIAKIERISLERGVRR